MSGWTIITGANRGIGFALAEQLKAKGRKVLAVCRQASEALRALDVRIVEGVDVSDTSSVHAITAALGEDKVDCLINNAGVLYRDSLKQLSLQELRQQFEVNSIGPLVVTQALLGHLQQGSKVAIVSSRMGSITDNTSGGMYGYRMSKAAANMVGQSLAVDLKNSGITVAILHPGFVRTGMTGGMGYIDAPEAAAGLIERIEALTIETTGGFWHANGESLPW